MATAWASGMLLPGSPSPLAANVIPVNGPPPAATGALLHCFLWPAVLLGPVMGAPPPRDSIAIQAC